MLYRLVTLTALALGGAFIAKQYRHVRGGQSVSPVRETVDVNVPVRVAYDQFTQFEQLPRFMHSVHEVRQQDDRHLHWRATVMGREVEWDAEITEQIPDQKIAWRSTSGTPNGGAVTFRSLGRSRTRVTLEMDYAPQDAIDEASDALGAVRATARANLKNFKEMIELGGRDTGEWRAPVAPHNEAGTHR
jgi:uncharacterized membrane protein